MKAKRKRLGWKVVFGISWIPALFLYGILITGLIHMHGPDFGGSLVGGIGFVVLLIPSILFAILQAFLGWLAFR